MTNSSNKQPISKTDEKKRLTNIMKWIYLYRSFDRMEMIVQYFVDGNNIWTIPYAQKGGETNKGGMIYKYKKNKKKNDTHWIPISANFISFVLLRLHVECFLWYVLFYLNV